MRKIGLSPYIVLIGAAIFCCLSLFLSAWLAIHQPWLGVVWEKSPDFAGVFVAEVQRSRPASLILSPNDRISSIRAVDGAPVALGAADLVEDPDVFPTFGEYHAFLKRQAAIAEILREPVAILTLDDGREVRLQPTTSRPAHSLPAKFWLLNAIGIISCLLGSGIFAVRLHLRAAQVYAIAGVGLLVSTMAMAVIASREFALEPELMLNLRAIYHVGNDIYALSAIFLLALYPARLKSLFLPKLVVLVMLFFLGNAFFEWTDLPGNTTLLQAPIYMAIALIIGILQWRNVRGSVIDQAAFKWFLLAFLVPTGMGCFLYFGLLLIHGHAVFSISVGLGCFLLMHVSLALGILKYRLFDIDRWWFHIWLWFFAGFSVLAVDGLLAYSMNLNTGWALYLSLLLVGWGYFPLRQWLLGRIYRRQRKKFEQYLPILVAGIVDGEKHGDDLWKFVLTEIFEPLSQTSVPDNLTDPEILQYGQTLRVPSICGEGAIEISFPKKGQRLFSVIDLRLVKELHKIARQTESRLAAQSRGAWEERERILRDLHDDVGGRLLSLVQTSDNQRTAHLAREALGALRDIVYNLDPAASITLDEALAKWRQNLAERCDAAGIAFEWNVSEAASDCSLTPRQWTNLSRVMTEALTNALKHAELARFSVRWYFDNQNLKACIRNDGVQSSTTDIQFGKGLNNMQRRLVDLNGVLSHRLDGEKDCFELQFSVPVSKQ